MKIKAKNLKTAEEVKNVLGNIKKEDILVFGMFVDTNSFQPEVSFYIRNHLLGPVPYKTSLELFGNHFNVREVPNLKLWNFTAKETFRYKEGQTVWWHIEDVICGGEIVHLFKIKEEEYYIVKCYNNSLILKTWGELTDDKDKPINLIRKIEEMKKVDVVRTTVLNNMDEILKDM